MQKRFRASVTIYFKDRKKGWAEELWTKFEVDQKEDVDKALQDFANEIKHVVELNDSFKVHCKPPDRRYGYSHCDMQFDSVEEMYKHWNETHSRKARRMKKENSITDFLKVIGQSQLQSG